MKKSGLEIGVLLVGALVIVGSLLVKFIFNLPANQTLIISNIIFSVGFLIYILYSIMTTNNLNKEIRGLNAHIKGLKKEIADKASEISSLKTSITSLKQEKAELEKQSEEKSAQLSELQKQLDEIRDSQNEPGK